MKKLLFSWITLCLALSALHAATLWTILVADIDDYDIGECVLVDLGSMKKEVKHIAESADMDLALIEITGDLLKKKFFTCLNQLQIESDDVILFYWSGHGYNNGDIWPYLNIERGYGVGQIEITETLYSLGARMILSMTDCCNGENKFIPQTFKVKSKAYTTLYRQMAKKHLYHLFRDFEGVILATSTEAGESSYCNAYHGGHFTYCFIEELNQYGLSWENIFKRTKQGVQEIHASQVPQYYLELKERKASHSWH